MDMFVLTSKARIRRTEDNAKAKVRRGTIKIINLTRDQVSSFKSIDLGIRREYGLLPYFWHSLDVNQDALCLSAGTSAA